MKHTTFYLCCKIIKMIFSVALVATALLPLAFSHPLEKRQNALPSVNSPTDESVLQLALYLENLERSLYTGGFENFTDAEYTAQGFPPGFRENVGVIAAVSNHLSHCSPTLQDY